MNEPKTITCTLRQALDNGLHIGCRFAIEYIVVYAGQKWDSHIKASALQSNGMFKEFHINKNDVIVFTPKAGEDNLLDFSQLDQPSKGTILIGDICTILGEKPENHFVVVDIEGNTISIYSNATGAIEVERENLTIIKRGGVAFFNK
jgi:hypothetical protein